MEEWSTREEPPEVHHMPWSRLSRIWSQHVPSTFTEGKFRAGESGSCKPSVRCCKSAQAAIRTKGIIGRRRAPRSAEFWLSFG